MTLKEVLQKADMLMDLNTNDPEFVSHNIPKIFNMLQEQYDIITTKMIQLRSKLEKEEMKYLDWLKHEAEFVIANKDERDIYMKGEEKINKINKLIRICERDLKSIENKIKIVMNLNFTIKNIMDYKTFKRGI